MALTIHHSPHNRAYDVFKSLFESELDLVAWLFKHKHKIVPDAIYYDGTDGNLKEFVESIRTQDLKTGKLTVFDDMPSEITVYGIGTHQERAEITWLSYESDSSDEPTELRQAEERVYERTLEDYKKWAKANGIKNRMPIMKK